MDTVIATGILRWNPTTAAAENNASKIDNSFMDMIISGIAPAQTKTVSETKSVSLEEMLKKKYPGLAYHVFDAGSRYWQTRNDYPHYLLYQENIDTEALENWAPSGLNPDMLSAGIQRNIASIPKGSKAVIIHPMVQERMNQEPEYAAEIMKRIDAWFTFDQVRNEAIIPGSTAGMSQSIAIGEDGSIVNVQASAQPKPFVSQEDGSKETSPAQNRFVRNSWYIQLWQQEQIKHSMEITKQFAVMQASQGIKTHLFEMLNSEELKSAFGDTIAGVSVEHVLKETRQAVSELKF